MPPDAGSTNRTPDGTALRTRMQEFSHRAHFYLVQGLRRNALIFQDLDVQGIVTRVLDNHPLSAFRWEVTQALPARTITTQYREDDFAFLTRLLADAGLAWHFEVDESAPGGHTWVIRDRDAPVPVLGPVRFHRERGQVHFHPPDVHATIALANL